MIGYGHGTIDAELAVTMAKQWHTLNQNIDAGTERTYHDRSHQPRPKHRHCDSCR